MYPPSKLRVASGHMKRINYVYYNLWIGAASCIHDLCARARRGRVPVVFVQSGPKCIYQVKCFISAER